MQERASTGMLGAERRHAILAALARDGKVVAARLVDEFGVSEDTIRRDLRELSEQGLLHRVHGGALPPPPAHASFARRRETSTDAKAALAEAAVTLLAPADVILLDGSTTNLEVARRLPADRPRTVLTNSPPIAVCLAEHPTAEVILIGGRLVKDAQVAVGSAAVEFVRSLRVDACVLGICALHPETGVTTTDLEEAHLKRAMVHAAADVIALATSDKLGTASAYVVAPATELTHLVVESDAPDELLDPFRTAGVTVTRA